MVEKIFARRCSEVLNTFPQQRVLVLGDVMLDEYIWGNVERISPEAPVPVVQVIKETWVPGGAANVAHNIRALGGEVVIVGLLGKDSAGRKLSALMKKNGIDISGLLAQPGRPTITKSRVLAGHQQAIRIDREVTAPVEKDLKDRLLKKLTRELPRVGAVVLEDYAKGLITQDLVEIVIGLCQKHQIPLIVDPNANNMFIYKGADLVTPNYKEALTAAGMGISAPIESIGRGLLRKWQAKSVLVTLGEDGMSLFQRREKTYQIETVAREVYDVSGAGDTVVSTLALSLSAGEDLPMSAFLANRAAGVVVGKLGTATASRAEILRTLDWQ